MATHSVNTHAQRLTQGDRSARTRRRLTDAAIRCLHRHGYAATSTTLIVEEAGLSRGALVHQFPAKADIMAAVLDAAFEDHVARYREALGEVADPSQRLIRLVRIAWDVFRLPSAAAEMEIRLAARSDPELARSSAAAVARIDAFAFEGIRTLALAAGLRDTARIRGVYGLMLSVLRGLQMEWISRPELAPAEETLALLERSVRRWIDEESRA